MLNGSELDRCAALMEEAAAWAMERIVTGRPRPDQVGTKANAADWVTESDLAVERFVRDLIAERFPEHRITGEEFGTTGAEAAPATWLIDPIDGTTNYVHALPWSSFSICVADEAGPAAGLVADPYRREVLSAVRGRGALLDGGPARCSSASTLTGAIVLTELSAQSAWDGMTELIEALAGAGCVTRILGSNALSVASVGSGRAAATVIGRFGAGDCLAGMLIAREAGATVLAASDPPADGETMICAAPGVVDELLEVWPRARAVAA
jgi:fructose-1,6-bisphosphatase/inositol monophosphatase family enzyme